MRTRTLLFVALGLGLSHCGKSPTMSSSSTRTNQGESGSLRNSNAESAKPASENANKDPVSETVECAGMLFYLQEDHGACDPADVPTADPARSPSTPATPESTPPKPETPKPTMDPAANGDANVVVFRIKAGTGNGPWNTKDSMVTLKKGQILRLVNDDSIVHRLHTNGAPCPHGNPFQAKASFDCVASKTFDATQAGPLYDHNAGPSAEFWVKVIP